MSINALPVEVLGIVLLHVTTNDRSPRPFVAQVISASLVCHHWRAVVLSTPYLWATINVFEQPCSDELFSVILQRSGSVPVSVRCAVDYVPLLEPHMRHISELQLPDIPYRAKSGLQSLLQCRVPILETLDIRSCTSLPTNLFNDCAPKLAHLSIDARAFSVAGHRPALRHLTSFELLYSHGDDVLTLDTLAGLLRLCPRLTDLRGVRSTPVNDSFDSRGIDNHLERLYLIDIPFSNPRRSARGSLTLCQHDRVKTIYIRDPALETLVTLATGMQDIQYLKVNRDEQCLEFVDERSFTRVFTGGQLGHAFPVLASLPVLKSLALSGSLPTSHRRPVLETLETLALSITHSSQFPLVRCPRLRLLRMEAKTPMSMDSSRVSAFLHDLLGSTRRKLAELQLHNVRMEWESDSAQLESLVEHIFETGQG